MNFFSKLSEIEAKGLLAVFCLVTKTRGSTPRHAGSKMIVFNDGQTYGTVGGGEIESLCISEALKLIKSGSFGNLNYKLVNPELGDPGICGGEVDIYLEVIGKKPKIIIVGAGHVGKQISKLANWLGFLVMVIDDRKELLTEDNLPDTNHRFESWDSLIESFPELDSMSTSVVLTTRSLEIDVTLIPQILKINPNYIGVIGSKKRWIKTTELLLNNGILESEIDNIYSPIGLDLKGETPEEIALSIMAEILKVKNNASGENLKYFRRKNN